MTEYLMYATGSAQPLHNATMTFLVTTDPTPLMRYLLIGLVIGVAITFIGVSVGKKIT